MTAPFLIATVDAMVEPWGGRHMQQNEGPSSSDLWRELAGWRQRVFAEMAPCATCAHYPACGGFWLADGSDVDVCRGWQNAFGMLADAWRAHRDELAGEARDASTE